MRIAISAGSSPRLRGARACHANRSLHVGIIPALAGSTRETIRGVYGVGDHPRACGEHSIRLYPKGIGMGSSPRLRGAHPDSQVDCRRRGIIPALAGSTERTLDKMRRTGDHPRACGEHSMSSSSLDSSAGSSPRLRGARDIFNESVGQSGIIPALAGSTLRPSAKNSASRDHPRACGEHGHSNSLRFLSLGSSPRLRGAHPRANGQAVYEGIIPALAGSTGVAASGSCGRKDHPRACGEH